MKHFVSMVILLLLANHAEAQFGLRAQMVNATIGASHDNQVQDPNGSFSHWGYDVGAHYWFRLQDHRIEFLPELSFGQFARTEITEEGDTPLKVNRYGISVPVSFYLLDFNSDCDCPTFSKQNELIKKGFFVQLIPAFYQVRSAYIDTPTGTNYHWSSQPSIGIGLGLDIGISDLLTITPIAHYFLSENLGDNLAPVPENEFRLGVRISFRPDY